METSGSAPKRLFLLDAYALIYRAYYALIKVPRITRDGFNTSAVFGFVNTLEEVLRKENPTHIAVAFDPHGPTFRHEADAAYKAEREEMPEDIRRSIPVIKEIIKAYRIPILEVPGFEADDVIGTMATRAAAEGFTTYMMTPDKDFGQLVGPQTLQYKPSYRGQDFELRGEREVCGRYGIDNTHQVIDLLALWGDKSDNIPGCPGVGEKTAVKLIQDFGSVENLLENTGRLKGALQKKIQDNAEQIRFSKFLATIRTDAPVDARPEDLVRREADTDALFAIFDSLEFRQLTDRVRGRIASQVGSRPVATVTSAQPSLFDEFDDAPAAVGAVVSLDPENAVYRTVSSREELNALNDRLLACGRCGLFIVSPGESDVDAPWMGAAVAWAPGEARFIPAGDGEGRAMILDLMMRADIEKVTPQSKRDYVLAMERRLSPTAEIPLNNFFDTTIAHYLLQPEQRHAADQLARTYLGYRMQLEPDLLPKGRNPQPVPAERLASYACEMADVCLRLRDPLDAELEKEELSGIYRTMELPMSGVLARMELAGVRIDVTALDRAAEAMTARIGKLQEEIYALAGVEFNIGSPSKVGEILFDRLDLEPKPKKTKTGQYSTAEDVLEKVAGKNPIVGMILLHRQLKKLLNTYLTALPAAINPRTGKIHTTYTQTVTATGRLSSTNPNLQNIPVRDEEGRDIRRAFIPDEGHLFLSADYSQIELRLAADFADDPTMIQAFREGDDIHAITAAKIYHKSLGEVSRTERSHAKTANFGILYGISAFGLASRLGIPRQEAKDLIDNYFATFPTIRKYMSDSVEFAREHGYVRTRLGRKRRLPDINSKNPVVRGYAERNAINAPLQGTAADIIKRAMVDIDAEMRARRMKSKMIMQVHDELNFDVVPEELPQMQELVTRLMEGAWSGRVPLTAESGVASNWLAAH